MPLTLTGEPLTVTANSEVDGALNVPLETKFQTETGAGSASLVVMRSSSSTVGEMMRSALSPTWGRRVTAFSATPLIGVVGVVGVGVVGAGVVVVGVGVVGVVGVGVVVTGGVVVVVVSPEATVPPVVGAVP